MTILKICESIEVLHKAVEQIELISNMTMRVKRFVTNRKLHFELVDLIALVKQSVSLSKFYSNLLEQFNTNLMNI